MEFKEWYFATYNEEYNEDDAHFGVFDEYREFISSLNIKEYIVEVTRGGYMGYNQWEEPIYINTENNEDYDDIFEQYVGKKVKLTIEVVE